MYLAIIILPLLASMASGLLGRKLGTTGVHILACLAVALASLLSCVAFFEVALASSSVTVSLATWLDSELLDLSWSFLFDSLTVSMLLPVLIVSALVHIYSVGYMAPDPHHQRFFAYLSMFTFFMLLLVCGDNFLVMFIGWEGVGVTSYLLISFWYTRVQATKSALQAIMVNRVGDWAFLIGLFLLFWVYGNLDFPSIFSLTPLINDRVLTLIGACLLVGAMAKSAQLGLHVWLPNAMEGPTPVSALLHAATMVVAGVFLSLRLSPLLEYSETSLVLLIWLGALTAFVASSIALCQNDIKRVIAYSTCSQLGMMFLSCGLSQYNLAVFHLVNHAFFKALLFLSAGAVIHAMHDEQDMRRLGGLGNILPFTYILMLIGSLSLMAVPFLTGFYSKDLIITASYGHYSLSGLSAYWLVTAGAALTATYSARLLYYTFWTQPRGPKASYLSSHEAPPVMAVPMAILALFAIFFGYLGQDLFIGMGSSLWNNALFQLPSHVIEAEFSVPVSLKVLPLIPSVVAPALLLSLFIRYPKTLEWLVTLHIWRTFYSFFNRSYLFDSLYAQIAGKFLDFGFVTAKTIDRGVLELLGPYGLTTLLTSTASRLSYLDTGFLPHYASYMLIGLVGYLIFAFVIQTPKLLILVLCLVLLLPYLSSSSVTPWLTGQTPHKTPKDPHPSTPLL